VTIGRVALGFSAASASGSSAGSATIEERIPDIFIASASAVETTRVASPALQGKGDQHRVA